MKQNSNNQQTKQPVWDGFVRSYHWLQMLCIGGLWYTGENGIMDWHFSIAYFFMALFVTRLIWGGIGSDTARFTSFVKSPKTALIHLKEELNSDSETHTVGHNPAGGYMVVAMFILITIQFSTGLFADDSIFSTGPFAHYVSENTVDLLTSVHHTNFKLLTVLIGLHVFTIFAYLFLKKINLIKPMLVGYKLLENKAKFVDVKMKTAWLALFLFLVIGTLIYIEFAFEVVPYLFN